MSGTEHLIDLLAADAAPVRRLASPWRRWAFWGALLLLAATAVLAILGGFAGMQVRMHDPALAGETIGAILTSLAALLAAFQLSVPDRSPRWALLPLLPALLWLGIGTFNCAGAMSGAARLQPGDGVHCFFFITAVSIPLLLAVFVLLRRGAALQPARVAAMGGLAAAGLATMILHGLHWLQGNFADSVLHTAAILLVVAVATALARPGLTRA